MVTNSHALSIGDGNGIAVGDVSVHSNTLLALGDAAGAQSAAIRLALSSGPSASAGVFRNNILHGGFAVERYGILEVENAGLSLTPQALENNNFNAVTAAWHHWNGTTELDDVSVADVNANNVAATDNQDVFCPLTNRYLLTAGSPCRNVGTAAGAPSRDIQDDPRPISGFFDIGADERE
jgi:hypothetical protein